MRLCDRIILRIICIFHYARIIGQGAQNLHIIRNFLQYFSVILNSFLIPSVSDEVNLRKIKHETTGNKQQHQQTLFIVHRKHNLIN